MSAEGITGPEYSSLHGKRRKNMFDVVASEGMADILMCDAFTMIIQ